MCRGILSLSWCSEDPDLLISCGKDNRLLIWNPSSETEVILNYLLNELTNLIYKNLQNVLKLGSLTIFVSIIFVYELYHERSYLYK